MTEKGMVSNTNLEVSITVNNPLVSPAFSLLFLDKYFKDPGH